jgi:hypothetical protein
MITIRKTLGTDAVPGCEIPVALLPSLAPLLSYDKGNKTKDLQLIGPAIRGVV